MLPTKLLYLLFSQTKCTCIHFSATTWYQVEFYNRCPPRFVRILQQRALTLKSAKNNDDCMVTNVKLYDSRLLELRILNIHLQGFYSNTKIARSLKLLYTSLSYMLMVIILINFNELNITTLSIAWCIIMCIM